MSIAEVHVRSWKGAYPGLIPQSYLDALRAEDRVGAWDETLADSAWPRRCRPALAVSMSFLAFLLVIADRRELEGQHGADPDGAPGVPGQAGRPCPRQ